MLEVSERARQLSFVTIVVHVICTINGLSISNENCVVWTREIRVWISHSHLFSCRIAQWRQASNEGDLSQWLIQIWASLCVIGGDSTEYLGGVLYYVLLHVLNQYNIQIVRGFQLYAFPITYCVDMCDWCFNVCMWLFLNSAKWWSMVEEVMYYACIPQIVYKQDNLYE